MAWVGFLSSQSPSSLRKEERKMRVCDPTFARVLTLLKQGKSSTQINKFQPQYLIPKQVDRAITTQQLCPLHKSKLISINKKTVWQGVKMACNSRYHSIEREISPRLSLDSNKSTKLNNSSRIWSTYHLSSQIRVALSQRKTAWTVAWIKISTCKWQSKSSH